MKPRIFRWRCFERSLNDEHLRAYLKRLPDFDDIEAEEKAFAIVQAFPDASRALTFFLRWASPAEAAKLVTKRATELDGDLYEVLTAAAEMLSARHPMAANARATFHDRLYIREWSVEQIQARGTTPRRMPVPGDPNRRFW